MMPHTDLPVLVLLLSPLAAALLSLAGKVVSERYISVPAFLIWLAGSAWALAVSAGPLFGFSAGGAELTRAAGGILYTLGGWAEPLGITLELNGITWAATITDVCIGTAAWLHIRRDRTYRSSFFFFFFMALFSLQGVLYTRDLFNLFVWFEVLSLSSFLLIVHHTGGTAYRAAIRYLIIGTVSIIWYLIGVWILYTCTGTLSLPTVASSLGQSSFPETLAGSLLSATPVQAAVALITAGILTRAAIIPFHTWLPEAHAAAPYPVSALLSGFVIKAPLLALWRIYDYVPSSQFGEMLVWLGAICAVFGVIAAMAQKDAKKLLGYHSVSQMGYIIAAFGFGGLAGKTAALFYIIAHALFKSLLFITVGRVTDEVGSRDVYTIRGMARVFPLQALLFAVAAFSISGVPLFAGYTAKILVSDALYYHGAYWLLTAAGIGTAASFFKLGRIFAGPFSGKLPGRLPGSAADWGAAFGAVLLAAGCLLLGVFPEAAHRFLTAAVTESRTLTLTGALGAAHGSAGAPAHIDPSGGPPYQWYALSQLLKSVLSIAAGFLISFLLVSKRGKSLSHGIRARELGLNGSLRLLTAGFLVLFLFGLFTA